MVWKIILVDLIVIYIVAGILTTVAMGYVQRAKDIKNPLGLVLCFFLWPIWVKGVIESYNTTVAAEAAAMLSQAMHRPNPMESMAKALAGMTMSDGVSVDIPENVEEAELTDISKEIDQANEEE